MADIKKNVQVNVRTRGAQKATKELEDLNGAIKKTNNGYKKQGKASRDYDRYMKGNAQMSANASKNFSKQAQSMQGVLVPAYAEVAARVFALTAAYTALENAADFGILIRGQQLYAERTGRNLGIVAKQIQEASGYMLDFQQASTSAGLAGTAGLNTQQILGMTKAARNASVALGRNLTDAFDRLTRGIVKGEPEILDEIGVLIRLDKVYADYAKGLNTTANQLTENQKLQARYNAVIGQTVDKFGNIAEQAGINAFGKLAASAKDALQQLSVGFDVALGPIANFLSEFKEGLYLVFALITKSLIGKIFPALTAFGGKFDDINKKIRTSAEVASKRAGVAASRVTGLAGEDIATRRAYQKGVQSLAGANIRAGSGLEAGLAANNQKKVMDSLSKAVKYANAQIQRNGKITKGIFAGNMAAFKRAEAAVNEYNAAVAGSTPLHKRVGITVGEFTAKTTAGYRGLKAAVTSWTASVVGAGIQHKKLVADMGILGTSIATVRGIGLEFTKLNRLINITNITLAKTGTTMSTFRKAGLYAFASLRAAVVATTGAIALMGKALSKVLAIFSALTIGAFIGDLVQGSSKSFSKASAAATELADSVNSVVTSLEKNADKLKDSLISTFAAAASSQEFKSNLATQLSESFDSAAKNITFRADGLTDSLAIAVDEIKSLFGAGIRDSIAEGVTSGLAALQKLGVGASNPLLNELEKSLTTTSYNEIGQAYQQISTAAAGAIARLKTQTATTKDLEVIEKELVRLRVDAVPLIQKLQAETKVYAREQAEFQLQTKNATDAVKGLDEALGDLNKSFTKKTPYDKAAASFESLLKSYKKLELVKPKALLIFGATGGETGTGPEFIKKYAMAVQDLAYIQAQVDEALANRRGNGANEQLQRDRDELQEYVNTLAKDLPAALENYKKFEEDLQNRTGFNPIQAQRAEILRAGRQEEIKAKIAQLDNSSYTNAKKTVSLSKELVDLDIERVQNNLKGYVAREKENVSVNTLISFQQELTNLEQKRAMLDADRTAELEKQAYALNKEVDYYDRIVNKVRQLSAGPYGSMSSALTYVNLEIANKKAVIIAQTMKDLASDFKTAMDTVASSFKTAVSDSIIGYATGEDKDPFSQTLGKGFLNAGAGMAGDLLTKGVFGRKGLLGSSLKGVFNSDFFDLVFPKDEIEIAQEQLEKLEEIKTAILMSKVPGFVGPTPWGGDNKLPDALGNIPSTFDTMFNEMSTGFNDIFNNLSTTLTGSGGNGGIFGTISGLFSGFDFGGMLTAANTGIGSFLGLGGPLFGAMGGYARGGFRALADGGTITKPTIGLIGEGKYNEAVVPLPDGRSIPVIGNTGGNTNNISVNVNVSSSGQATSETEGGSGKEMKELGYRISQAVQEEIMIQQRPGGLLNASGDRSYG